jgi:hypothetical protein
MRIRELISAHQHNPSYFQTLAFNFQQITGTENGLRMSKKYQAPSAVSAAQNKNNRHASARFLMLLE